MPQIIQIAFVFHCLLSYLDFVFFMFVEETVHDISVCVAFKWNFSFGASMNGFGTSNLQQLETATARIDLHQLCAAGQRESPDRQRLNVHRCKYFGCGWG